MREIPDWQLPRTNGGAAAWRPIVELAQRACAWEPGVALSWKTKYDDLSLMPVAGGSAALHDLLDILERLAERIDPETGAARAPAP